jgi:hypothetical protein
MAAFLASHLVVYRGRSDTMTAQTAAGRQPREDGSGILLDLIMTSNGSLARWLWYPVPNVHLARLLGRVLFSPAGARPTPPMQTALVPQEGP